MLYQSMMTDILKAKIKTYCDKVYTDFCGLNVPEDDLECEYFTLISIDSCISKQIFAGNIFRQLCLLNCRQASDR